MLKLEFVPVKLSNLHISISKKTKKTYSKEVKRGKSVARMLGLKQGTCLGREVINYMIEEGSLVPGPDKHEHWISAVFAKSLEWKWSGKWGTNTIPSFNGQGGPRGTKVWVLRNPFLSQLLMEAENNEWH